MIKKSPIIDLDYFRFYGKSVDEIYERYLHDRIPKELFKQAWLSARSYAFEFFEKLIHIGLISDYTIYNYDKMHIYVKIYFDFNKTVLNIRLCYADHESFIQEQFIYMIKKHMVEEYEKYLSNLIKEGGF